MLFILVASTMKGLSQYNDFDLSKYKLPDLDRRALETDYSISGYANRVYETAFKRFSADFDLNYSRFQNTKEYQKESDLGFSFGYDINNSKEDGNLTSKQSYLNPTLFYQGGYRHYNDRLIFMEAGLMLGSQYYQNKYTSLQVDGSFGLNNMRRFDLVTFIPLKIGKGRIEPVEDLRHAIYLFEELAKIQRLSADKTEDEIVEFAEYISRLKNKRFFDSRLKRIAEIESLDSFLISNGHVSIQDAPYFTTLGDYWDYGNRPLRNTGTRISGMVSPGFYFPGLFNDIGIATGNGLTYMNSLFMLDGGIDVKHEKPVNLFWQNTVDLNCYLGIYEGRFIDFADTDEYSIRIPNFNVSYSQKIGFYPNTRTNISLAYSIRYLHSFETDLSDEFNAARFETIFLLNYYFSPKLRLNAFSTFFYYWQDSDDIILSLNPVNNEFLLDHFDLGLGGSYITLTNELFHRFQVSLVYSIF